MSITMRSLSATPTELERVEAAPESETSEGGVSLAPRSTDHRHPEGGG